MVTPVLKKPHAVGSDCAKQIDLKPVTWARSRTATDLAPQFSRFHPGSSVRLPSTLNRNRTVEDLPRYADVVRQRYVTLVVLLDYVSADFDTVEHRAFRHARDTILSEDALQRHTTIQSNWNAVCHKDPVAAHWSLFAAPRNCKNLSTNRVWWSSAQFRWRHNFTYRTPECQARQAEHGSCHSRRQTLECFIPA